jgi:hypothetical protein
MYKNKLWGLDGGVEKSHFNDFTLSILWEIKCGEVVVCDYWPTSTVSGQVSTISYQNKYGKLWMEKQHSHTLWFPTTHPKNGKGQAF